MTIDIDHGATKLQIAIAPIYPETVVTLVTRSNYIAILQNDEIVSIVYTSIMKVVRAIRKIYPKVNLQLI